MTTDVQLRSLVAWAREGDPDAWEALYRRAYPRLFAYARRRLATDEQAEDAVSEAMVRAMKRIVDFTWSGAGFDGWLFGIVRNVVYEAYRQGAKSVPTDANAPGAEVAWDGPGPLDGIVADEETTMMRTAFSRLTDADRQVLELRVVVGLDSAQAAAVMGRESGAVRTAQSRALQRLRHEYEGLLK